LVGTNETRHRRNRKLRHLHGFAERYAFDVMPQIGESVVCLRNDYTVDAPVFNGSVWRITDLKHIGDEDLQILKLHLADPYNGTTVVHAPVVNFTEQQFDYYPGFQQFDFGYALTVHKAQGSEYGSVMLINEAARFRGQARRWLYTGITRARKRLSIVDYS
jgi:exodeoxyribonuclease-5